MHSVDPIKAGLGFGGVLGLWHLGWALMVALGWAQPFLDFRFRLHFVEPAYRVAAFDGRTAVLLVLTSLFAGFVFGVLVALACGWARRREMFPQ